MEEIVAYAQARDLSIVPICGYAAHWLARRERR
jgi:predicted GNAT family acetyltransferase